MSEWLTEEEQYKDILNNEEISRIKDRELREIRMRHWEYQTKIFLDESNISDEMLCKLADEDREIEKKEIEEYRKRKKL